MIMILLLGCQDISQTPLHFDGPIAAAVLPAGRTPFFDPIGFVANQHSGTILPLNLKEGRFLTDDPMASFLPASALATGQERILSDVAVTSPGATAITLWASDNATQTLLRIPYITRFEDGNPVEVEPAATEPVFVDADGSGDSVSLDNLVLRPGYTTTEDWSVSYNGSSWWVKGSRSGLQTTQPTAGKSYRSDHGELEFTLNGTATVGDRIDLHTDTGIFEWRLGGLVSGILASNGRLYASVLSDPPQIVVMDTTESEASPAGSYVGAIALPAGSQPGRLAVAPDGRVFVADGGLPTVWVLHFEQQSNPQTVPVDSIAAAAPVIDVAYSAGEGADGLPYEHLFIAPFSLQRVDVWDLAQNLPYDPNPMTADTEGVNLGAPVSGLGSSVGSVFLQQPTDWGAYPRVPVVGVTTQDGLFYALEGSTGCAVQTAEGAVGPTPYTDANDASILIEDQGITSNTSMYLDESTGKQIVTSPCGGVTHSEQWTVTYDASTLSWEVEGSISGIQANVAYEDERYVSDSSAISFLLLSGNLPTTDGDRFTFSTDAGLAFVAGTDSNDDSLVERPWELPSRPVAFDYTGGPSGGGWDPVNRREFMLIPVENTDISARLSLDSMDAQVLWN